MLNGRWKLLAAAPQYIKTIYVNVLVVQSIRPLLGFICSVNLSNNVRYPRLSQAYIFLFKVFCDWAPLYMAYVKYVSVRSEVFQYLQYFIYNIVMFVHFLQNDVTILYYLGIHTWQRKKK